MADAIQLSLDSNAAQVVRQLGTFPERMQQEIAKALDYENEITVGQIQAKKLSRRGPTTLGVVSNRLRSSVRPTKAVVSPKSIESSIGSNVKYAGVHEYGFHGTVNVRGFTRRQTSNDLLAGGARRGFKARQKREKLQASGIARVKAHTRRMNIPARAYIRTTIEERRAAYGSAVSKAIVSAWEGGAS